MVALHEHIECKSFDVLGTKKKTGRSNVITWKTKGRAPCGDGEEGRSESSNEFSSLLREYILGIFVVSRFPRGATAAFRIAPMDRLTDREIDGCVESAKFIFRKEIFQKVWHLHFEYIRRHPVSLPSPRRRWLPEN